MPRRVCINCLDGARSGLFKLNLDVGQHLYVDETDFIGREMIGKNNPAKAMIYYYVAKAGENSTHTVIIIPHNGYDIDSVWLNDESSMPSNRKLGDDIR